MNNPDLSTVAAGQVRDEMKKRIEVLIHQPPELTVRLRIAEACEWLRMQAPGRALEVLEELLAEFEQIDHAPECPRCGAGMRWLEFPNRLECPNCHHSHLACGCPREMRSLCPHGNSDLA